MRGRRLLYARLESLHGSRGQLSDAETTPTTPKPRARASRSRKSSANPCYHQPCHQRFARFHIVPHLTKSRSLSHARGARPAGERVVAVHSPVAKSPDDRRIVPAVAERREATGFDRAASLLHFVRRLRLADEVGIEIAVLSGARSIGASTSGAPQAVQPPCCKTRRARWCRIEDPSSQFRSGPLATYVSEERAVHNSARTQISLGPSVPSLMQPGNAQTVLRGTPDLAASHPSSARSGESPQPPEAHASASARPSRATHRRERERERRHQYQ